MQPAIRFLCLAFTTLLSITATGANAAVSTPPDLAAPAPAAVQLKPEDVLDEVWVHGKRLSERIAKAEDDFFKLYNKLNKNHNYDVHCGYMQLDRGSLAMIRTCMPGFIVYNYYDLAGQPVSQCSSTALNPADGSLLYSDRSILYSSRLYTGCTSAPVAPPALLAMEHRMKYQENVLRVISGDTRLLEMGAKLAVLYDEMTTVQGRYVSLKGPDERSTGRRVPAARKPTRPVKAQTGPRAL